jgi:hypothetical protein
MVRARACVCVPLHVYEYISMSGGVNVAISMCMRVVRVLWCGSQEHAQVACLPGVEFGLSDSDHLIVRMAYVNFDGTRALEAVAALKDGQEMEGDAFVLENAPDVVAAGRSMAKWVASL